MTLKFPPPLGLVVFFTKKDIKRTGAFSTPLTLLFFYSMDGSDELYVGRTARKSTSPLNLTLTSKRKIQCKETEQTPNKVAKVDSILKGLLEEDLLLSPEQEQVHTSIIRELNFSVEEEKSENNLKLKNKEIVNSEQEKVHESILQELNISKRDANPETNTKFKSQEFLPSSESSDSEIEKTPKHCPTKQNEESSNLSDVVKKVSNSQKQKTLENEHKKTVLLNSLPVKRKYKKTQSLKNNCEYTYKKGVKNGTRCSNLCLNKFCSLHDLSKKNVAAKSSNEFETSIKNLQFTNHELQTKIEYIMNEKISVIEKQIKNMSETIEEMRKRFLREKIHRRKLYKLNKCLTYELVGCLPNNGLILKSDGTTFHVSAPQGFHRPALGDTVNILIYSEESKMFLWAEKA